MRLVLLVGKGGVGKTTLSVATASAAARRGSRVLVVSTDAAHSLADALDCRLTDEPLEVAENLHAAQLDGRRELEGAWADIAQYLRTLLGMARLDQLHTDELVVVPGLDQLLALVRLRSLMATDRWDSIVVDCAPSADSLRLFSLPDVLDWYGARIFGRDGTIRSRVRRTLERTLTIAAPDEKVISSVTQLSEALSELRTVLGRASTTARIVTTPERLAVSEAQRTLSYLALYGYAVDAVLVNRVIDETDAPPALLAWREHQSTQLQRIAEAFGPLPRLLCHLRGAEPIGVSQLREVGAELYGDVDPLARLSEHDAIEISSDRTRTWLRVPVSGLELDQVLLHRVGTELVVTLGPYRRAVALPDGLSQRAVTRAGIVDGALQVEFEEPAGARR